MGTARATRPRGGGSGAGGAGPPGPAGDSAASEDTGAADCASSEAVEVMACRLQAEVAIGLANIAVLQAQVQTQSRPKRAAGPEAGASPSASASTTLDRALKSQEELCRQLYRTIRERDDTIGELRARCESLESKLAEVGAARARGDD